MLLHKDQKNISILEILVRPILIKSIAIIKRHAISTFKEKQLRPVLQPLMKLIAGKFDDQFPLKVWQTGSGTQTNMNVNELLLIELLKN